MKNINRLIDITRLINIETILREAVVLAGIFGFSVGVFVLAMLFGQQALQPYLGKKEWFIPAIALLIVTFAVRPIERLIYNTIGRFLFKKRAEYQKALQDAAVGMAAIRDPRKLLGLIVHIVSKKMRLDNVSIFIYEDEVKGYQLKASRGERKPRFPLPTLSHNHPLAEWLREKKEPLVLEELQRWIRDEKTAAIESVLTSDLIRIQQEMERLNASICVPSFYRDDLLSISALGNKKSGDFFSRDDLDLLNTLADEAAVAIKNSQLYYEIEERAKEIEALYQKEHRLFMHASVAFAAAIDARDPYTHGHSERVTNYSLAILDYIGSMPEIEDNPTFRQRLQIAAILHDIGKIGVSDDVLHKPARLSPEEKEEIERHSVIGAEIVSHIKGLLDIVGAIKHHHERYDGQGYPDRLRSKDIPFVARIIAVADTFDAVTSDRPYRKGLSLEMAKEEIRKNASVQFDPYVVEAFLRALEGGKIKRNIMVKSPVLLP